MRIAPSASFSLADWTINIIFIVVIGGIGSLEGPILGAMVFFVLRQYLADFGAWYLVAARRHRDRGNSRRAARPVGFAEALARPRPHTGFAPAG